MKTDTEIVDWLEKQSRKPGGVSLRNGLDSIFVDDFFVHSTTLDMVPMRYAISKAMEEDERTRSGATAIT